MRRMSVLRGLNLFGVKPVALLLSLCIWLPPSQAAEGEGSYVEYIELQPPFVANYGGPGPLKYLKADVSIKVKTRQAEEEIKLHVPQIRNALVMLLSAQTDDTISTAAGREQLRQKALEDIRQILVTENGEEGYEMPADLLFTSFIVQN